MSKAKYDELRKVSTVKLPEWNQLSDAERVGYEAQFAAVQPEPAPVESDAIVALNPADVVPLPPDAERVETEHVEGAVIVTVTEPAPAVRATAKLKNVTVKKSKKEK